MRRCSKKRFLALAITMFTFLVTPTAFADTFNWGDDAPIGTNQVLANGDELVLAAGKTIKISGDREITVSGNATVNVGAAAAQGAVAIRPADNTDAQLVFNVAKGHTLTINVWNDLSFTSANTGNKPFYVSFRGEGKTCFRLPSGNTVYFGQETPGASVVGTHVRILTELLQEASANNQLVFEKWSYKADSVNSDLTKHSFVTFDQHSSLSFISTNRTGVSESEVTPGHSAIAFDPTNEGQGRLVLKLARGAVAGDFKDAGFNVHISRVVAAGSSPTNTELRTGVAYKYRAGMQAALRVVDGVLQRHYDGNAAGLAAHYASPLNRRGLVILNNNNSFPRLANFFDQSADLSQSPWYTANTYQTGFVVGNNGVLDVGHNLFIDYIAGSTNQALSGKAAYGNHAADAVKKHNPSALIIDGMAFNDDDLSGYEYDGVAVAQVLLRGHAGLYVRCGALSSTGAIDQLTRDVYIDCTIGKGAYNGTSIPVLANDGSLSPVQSTSLDGEHALDIEGWVKFVSLDGPDGTTKDSFINVPTVLLDHAGYELKFESGALSRATARPLSKAATVNYYRYNTSSVLVNDRIDLDGVRWIHNDVSRDSSLLPVASDKALPAIVGGELTSLKAARLLGDEILNNDPIDFSGPAVYLSNATIACHESLVSAGIRWVVTEKFISVADGQTWQDAHNTSHIAFYNRGNDLDQEVAGYGRVFQLGSRANVMESGSAAKAEITFSDGTKSVNSLRDSFVDIYRQEPSPDETIGSNANTIKLSLTTSFEEGVTSSEKAMHLVYMANRSQINLGWTTEEVDKRYTAWEFGSDILTLLKEDDPGNVGNYRFAPYTNGYGELEVAGDNIYFGAGGRFAATGQLDPVDNELPPRGVSDNGGLIFVDHGGKITAAGSYDMHLNTILACRVGSVEAASGKVALPYDQILIHNSGGIHTYGLTGVQNTSPHIVGNNTYPVVTVHVPSFAANTAAVKSFDIGTLPKRNYFMSSRATSSISAPVPMPSSGLLVMTTGDKVEQFRASGATRTNPLHLYLSGDANGFSRVREFVDIVSEPQVIGEGAYAALFVDGSARFGLGNRGWNSHSLRAWNKLGEDAVNIFANGNAVIDVNSDLLVVDKLPLVATENFGATAGVTHRITFYSESPREIRIPANAELDLSSFGQGGQPYAQQIAFAGHIRLIVEPGAKIRLPSLSDNTDNAPILYFNDSSQLIFAEQDHRDAGRFTNGWGADKVRAKILGTGQIWLNKNAQLRIDGNALVSIESDKQTPHTDVVISIARQAAMYIGDNNRAGGGFQIGNIVDGGGDGSNATGQPGAVQTAVSFKLAVNGPSAKFHMNREAFFGLAVGVVNKSDNPNGETPDADSAIDSDTAWRVQSLFNVKNLTLDFEKGFVDHNQIFDGSDRQSSLLAVGPLDYTLGGRYTLKLGDPNQIYVRGGGNLLYVDAGILHTDPMPVNIWSTAEALNGADSGKYTLMAPDVLTRTYTSLGGATISSTTSSYQFQSTVASDFDSQGAALGEFFTVLRMPNYVSYSRKIIAAGRNLFTAIAGYVNGTEIKRRSVAVGRGIDGTDVPALSATEVGYFVGSSASPNGDPETFIVPS